MANLDDTARRPELATTPLSPMCPSCGRTVGDGDNFCPTCGYDLRAAPRSSESSPGVRAPEELIDRRYRVLELLGEGGMGSVYKVEHVRMGKIAALKLMRPHIALDKALKSRFLQEARTIARLSHPNTVQVFDTGELSDGSLYIAMEFVPGRDLAWHLKSFGPISEERAAAIGVQVLLSLQEAHEAGVVHRDLKPANIILVRRRKGREESAKLLDFGIAKLQEDGRKSLGGEFVGTPAYMSPEQARGEVVDGRSDLYSLGALLFELVSGHQPYTGESFATILTRHQEAPIPRVVERAPGVTVSPAFEAVLRRAMAKQPGERYRDADAMRLALEPLSRRLTLGPSSTIPPGPSSFPEELQGRMLSREDFDRFERSLRWQRTLAPLVALAVLAAGAAGAWALWGRAGQVVSHREEVEPNDSAEKATRIAVGAPVKGAIGASRLDSNDRDVFTTQVTAGLYRVTLTEVPDLNLSVEVAQLSPDGRRLERVAFLDDVGPGTAERLDGVGLRDGTLWLRVEEGPFVTEAPRPNRERALVPYTLAVESLPPPTGEVLEVEPDDAPGSAMLLRPGVVLRGFTGAPIDDLERRGIIRGGVPFTSPDWYRIEASPDVALALVVEPPRGGTLLALDAVAHERWLADAASGRRSAPQATQVTGLTALALTPDGNGHRRVRLSAAPQVAPGSEYRLLVVEATEEGIRQALALAPGGPEGAAPLQQALNRAFATRR